MKGLKLRHLRFVAILHEEGSVSRAAARLHVSPAAVSKARAEIEGEIGARLFARDGAGLQLTEAGLCVVQAAKRVLAEVDTLGEEMRLMQTGVRGTVSVGMRSVAAQPFLARATSAFKARHPGITVRLIDGDLPTLLERLQKGELSLVVGRADLRHGLESLDSRQILSDPNVVIASPGHPLAKKASVGWRELVAQRWVLTPEGYAGPISRERFAVHLAAQGLALPADVVEANSMLMIVTLFQASRYLSLAPLTVGEELERNGLGHLVKVPPVGPIDPVRLVWRANLPLPPAARRFRDFVIAMLEREGGERVTRAIARRFGAARLGKSLEA